MKTPATEKARLHAHYLANRELVLARVKTWAEEHRAESNAIKARWARRHPENAPERKRRWRKRHARPRVKLTPEQLKRNDRARSRRNYLLRREQRIAAARTWIKAHPDLRRSYCRTFRALRKGSLSADFTARDWAEMKEHFDQRCSYCGEVKPLTQDHVIPVSRGGAHTASNIVPACHSCNCSKGNKTLAEWRSP